jgi:nucleotide-binding universal stress UspA family protein
MTCLDVLLHIESYPTQTDPSAIDEAVAVAASLGGGLTGLAIEVELSGRSNRLADYVLGLNGLAEEEEARSRAAGRECLEGLAKSAEATGIIPSVILARVNPYEAADHVAKIARTYDICLLPLFEWNDSRVEVAQAIVCSSGRPLLIFRSGDAAGLASGPDLVVIAWDGSRNAARAMADAMPILTRARQVRLLTVLNDKPEATASLGLDAQRHLRAHGIEAALETVDRDSVDIGSTLDQYIQLHAPDLLVMGAYGHSRAREYLLGGATEYMLNHPRCPVFLSN